MATVDPGYHQLTDCIAVASFLVPELMRTFKRSLLTGIMLLSAHLLSAKAPTARITITGGKLTRPVVITDNEVLQVSPAWSSAFLDLSRPPLEEVPKVSSTYEVTLYSEIGPNDIRKTCVFFYIPGFSAAQGLIYLPGNGTLWALNAGTIIRQGRDGKWSYASPSWEALITPFIVSGEGGRQTLLSGASANSLFGEHPVSEVIIEKWAKPKPGWLYILDPRSGSYSRVWLLDPEKSKVMGSIQAGYDPDFALSKDGSRLYIASGERESGELNVVDTSTGEIHHVPFADRVLYRPWYQALPPFSSMAVSSDGLAVGILGHHVFSPEKIESRLWIFDALGERFQKKSVDLGDCVNADFVPSSDGNRFKVFCEQRVAHKNSVRLIDLNEEYREMAAATTTPDWPNGCDFAESFPIRSTMAVIRTDGAIYEGNSGLQNLRPTSITGDCRQWTIARGDWPRSPDGAKVYLGYGGIAPNGMSAATELVAFETTTWTQLGRIQTSVPFWSAVVSHNGKQIYAVAPESHRVLIIDAVTFQERRAINVGDTPSLALVAP